MPHMPKVLITCHHLQSEFKSLRPRYEAVGVTPVLLKVERQQLNAAAMREAIVGMDAVIAGDDEIDASVLEAGKASRLKAIIKWGIGTDGIDKQKAAELNIPVYNTPGMFSDEVSDLALSLLLNVARQTHAIHHSVKAGGWLKLRGRTLGGMTAGIIGMGSIGLGIARRAVAFGMKPIAYDVRALPDETLEELGILAAGLDQLLGESDVIFLACDLTFENRHFINAEAFRKMKNGVYIVNVSRGALINEAALCAALESGKVAGAGLDVFEVEPLPKDSPLRHFESCVFSTHNGSNTNEAVARVNEMTTAILFHVLGLAEIAFSPNRVA